MKKKRMSRKKKRCLWDKAWRDFFKANKTTAAEFMERYK